MKLSDEYLKGWANGKSESIERIIKIINEVQNCDGIKSRYGEKAVNNICGHLKLEINHSHNSEEKKQ